MSQRPHSQPHRRGLSATSSVARTPCHCPQAFSPSSPISNSSLILHSVSLCCSVNEPPVADFQTHCTPSSTTSNDSLVISFSLFLLTSFAQSTWSFKAHLLLDPPWSVSILSGVRTTSCRLSNALHTVIIQLLLGHQFQLVPILLGCLQCD